MVSVINNELADLQADPTPAPACINSQEPPLVPQNTGIKLEPLLVFTNQMLDTPC